eukprot:g39192.t1
MPFSVEKCSTSFAEKDSNQLRRYTQVDTQYTEQLLKLLEDEEEDDDEYYDPEDEPENFRQWLTRSVTQAPVWGKVRHGFGGVYSWSSWSYGKVKSVSFYLSSLGFLFFLPIAFAISSEVAMIEMQKQARQNMGPGQGGGKLAAGPHSGSENLLRSCSGSVTFSENHKLSVAASAEPASSEPRPLPCLSSGRWTVMIYSE